MGLLARLLSGGWSLDELPVPWGDRPSIFGHLMAHIAPHGVGLTDGGETLPDEDRVFPQDKLRWIAGGLDGAFGHHGGAAGEPAAVDAAFDAIVALLGKASAERLAELYEVLLAHHALELVDPLLTRIASSRLDPRRLHRLATWLVSRAPDREPVKLGIAILGLFSPSPDRELLLVLGRHEELTLFAATALANTQQDHHRVLWELAKQVHGWGRIATVERLAGTTDPEIRAWLLREGYRNTVMHEYLAQVCATTGGLVEALQAPQVDEALLTGAGEILVALVEAAGNAFRGIDDYPDGAEAIRRYLGHVRSRTGGIEHFLAVHSMAVFLRDEDADWEARASRGFTPGLRAALEVIAGEILAMPCWPDVVAAGLEAVEPERFYLADRAAAVLGIDTWERHLGRLDSFRSPSWYLATRTEDPERLARFLAAAKARLPLAEIASGPGRSLGMSPEHAPHGALDFVLQALGGLPGQGWEVVRAALASPVVRNRTGAVRVLTTWGRPAWPQEAQTVLLEAVSREPDDELRDKLRELLDGPEPVN